MNKLLTIKNGGNNPDIKVENLDNHATKNSPEIQLARELHDRLGPILASISLKLDQIIDSPEQKELDLDSLAHQVIGAKDEFRSILSELRSNRINSYINVVSAINTKCAELSQNTNISFDYVSNYSIQPDIETQIAIIASEGLTNVQRHAEASNVQVTWISAELSSTLEISDDGKGFDPHIGVQNKFGIIGMRERAKLIGAKLSIKSTKEKGTVLRCILET